MFKREIIDEIKSFLFTDDIILLYGARQVGKTSIMQYLQSQEKRRTFFYDLENTENLDLFNQSQERFIDFLKNNENRTEDEKIVVFIDEVQYMENPTSFLKYLHDHYRKIKFIVSGSSTLDIRGKMKDSMAGRLLIFNVYPLNFYEYLIFKGKDNLANQIRKNISFTMIQNELKNYYQDFCLFWGYPKIVLTNDQKTKKQYLQQIIKTYIEKDIQDIGKIREVEKFNQLLKILASQSWNLLNISELSSDSVGVSRETINNRLLLLENTFVINKISTFSQNIRSELIKMPKLFFADTGIRNMLLNQFEIDGACLENAIFSDLFHSHRFENIKFYRTQDKKEIDFIIDEIPYEVKLNYNGKTLTSLEYFEKKYAQKGNIISLTKNKNSKYSQYYPWEI